MIRLATPADAAVIASIHNETIATRSATMETEPKTAEGVAAWMAELSDREEVHVLELDGTVVGWGVLKLYSPRPGYRFTGETSVFLRHALRRQGHGTAIKHVLLARARHHGYHHLLARIVAANRESIAYNQRLGYELVGIQKEAGYLDGRFVDIAVLQLLLDDD